MKFQKIYDLSPIWFQNVMSSIYGYIVKKQRYGMYYKKHLKKLAYMEKLSEEDLNKFQIEEMKSFLNYAVTKSEFYKAIYKKININNFNSIKSLENLPIIKKDILRQNISTISTISKHKGIISTTGGTTGKSLEVVFTKEDNQKGMAVLDFFKLRYGFANLKMRRATFMGKHIVPRNQVKKIYWRYNFFQKQMLYSSFHLNRENIKYYIRSLNKFKPKSIDGFVSSIYEIAKYILSNKITLNFKPLAIFTTSETVTSYQRDIIEKAFQSKIRDQYASSEGAPFVWECHCGKYHLDYTSGIIENKKDSNEILVTSFLSHGTPLIRYDIGDIMFISENYKCDCGSKSTVIDSIVGRNTDFLYAANGTKIYSANLSNSLKYLPNNIIRAKFIQNDLNSIDIKLVVDGYLDENQIDSIKNEIFHKFGYDIVPNIEIVDSIPLEKSGKYRFVDNNIK